MSEGDRLVAERTDDAFYGALVEDDPEDLYDNAPCAYLSTLPDGTIVKANATFLRWTGYDRHDLVGRRRFQELLAPGDRIFHETHYAPALRLQGQVREIAVEIVTARGVRLPIVVNSVLTRDPSGEPVVIRSALFDATERRSYEQELLAARQRAEASEARAIALARTLQSTLLPAEIPAVPGLDIAGAYRPAGDGSEVGGDFYDVFRCGDTSWGVVLGDVCGKGAGAAVLTSLARHTVRAEAQRTSSPSDVLRALHDAFLRFHPERFCTALLLLLDTSAGPGRLRATIASGGHQLPLRRRADGTSGTVGEGGSIIGMLERPELSDRTFDVAAGDVLVLVTDGVAEARRRDRDFFGSARLDAVVARHGTANAQTIADATVAAAVDFQEGDARDDIAVLVIRAD